jgi:signal transduction histidine kinase
MFARLIRITAFRYSALYTLIFVASVLALFLTIYWSIAKSLQDNIAKDITAQMTALSASHGKSELPELVAAVNRLTATSGGERVYLLLDPAGKKIAGNLDNEPPRNGWTHLTLPVNTPGSPLQDNSDDDGDPSHDVLVFGMTLSDGSFLLVGDDADPVSDAKEATMHAFLLALIPTLALGCAGGAFLSLSYLKRIDAINQASREIVDGDLSRRIGVRGTNDEMDKLSSNLNDMFERMQILMGSLKQVSADIAHDLRTPLSHLRQRLEAARAAPQTAEVYESAIDHAITQVDEILTTFSALVRIAQIESRTRRSAFAEQNLSELFAHVANAYAGVAADKGQILSVRLDEHIGVFGDRSLLVQMLSNLIENALQHTPSGARIEVSLTRIGPDAVGVIADSGPGIPESERDNVLKRFYRLDRSRSTPGNGLGLALVAAVAELHGVKVKLGDNDPGLRVTLKFSHSQLADRAREPSHGEFAQVGAAR